MCFARVWVSRAVADVGSTINENKRNTIDWNAAVLLLLLQRSKKRCLLSYL